MITSLKVNKIDKAITTMKNTTNLLNRFIKLLLVSLIIVIARLAELVASPTSKQKYLRSNLDDKTKI